MTSKKKPQQISSPLRQLTLNFGQKSPRLIQKTTECKECGMIFNSNDKHDEQLHVKYHNDRDNCLKYTNTLFKNEKIVQDYLDGKVIVIENGFDSNQSVNKALQLLEYVDKQLGINELENEKDIIKRLTLINKNSKFYFFIDKLLKKIVGFCLAEQIDKAYKINEIDQINNDAKCGINRIWVASEMRHKKIATRLLDCVCFNFFYVYKLSPNQLAFSDPTPNGRLLAKSYCNCESFLIYNSNKNCK